MKQLFVIVSLLFGSLTTDNETTIQVGDSLPFQNMELTRIDGSTHQLKNLKGENGLLIVFAANKCIAVEYWYDRLVTAGKMAEENGIEVIWVNSNQTQRMEGESLRDMKAFADNKSLPFDYLLEEDFQLANKFDTKVTPTSYLFDKDDKLVYMGITDNNMVNAEEATEHYLKDALEATVAGQAVSVPVKFGRGCRIPRS